MREPSTSVDRNSMVNSPPINPLRVSHSIHIFRMPCYQILRLDDCLCVAFGYNATNVGKNRRNRSREVGQQLVVRLNTVI